MAYFTQKAREERLKGHALTLLTEYDDGGVPKRRSSDHTQEDDVCRGIILDKQYFRGGRRLLQETEFNPGIFYGFQFPRLSDGRIRCPNCGAAEERARFRFGCPYCGTFYNLEYANKNFGSREHSDYVVKEKALSPTQVLLCFLPLALSLLVFFVFSRTHTPFDLLKGLLVGLLLSGIILLAVLHQRSSVQITPEGRKKKQRQDDLLPRFAQDLEAIGLGTNEFINLLHAQLGEYYFGPDSAERCDVVDFDVLDYREQTVHKEKKRPARISLLLNMRLVRDDGRDLHSEELVLKAVLQQREAKKAVVKPGTNILACPNCGASIDLSADRCAYCGTPTAWQSPLVLLSLDPVSDD